MFRTPPPIVSPHVRRSVAYRRTVTSDRARVGTTALHAAASTDADREGRYDRRRRTPVFTATWLVDARGEGTRARRLPRAPRSGDHDAAAIHASGGRAASGELHGDVARSAREGGNRRHRGLWG